ncbi:magnesium transporter [Nitrosomonas eutropha]|uniref:Magnesium transport protein CorA n=1 Tax=Nitrosomonas eutropha TaxID=916 RepID=A0A1I7IQI8_9PROT|nr:magnesium/cobalt transporter CorA [Nitrosomonas eutropha]SFU75189.1 magnesium transporter [Nitrosomonas eutropha]
MKHKITTSLSHLRKHHVRVRNYRPGAPPGSLEALPIAGSEAMPIPLACISLLRYGKSGVVEEQRGLTARDCQVPAANATDITWLHLQGLPAPEQLQALSAVFGLHPLALEDVFHRETRSKIEAYEAQQFVVLNYLHQDQTDKFNTGLVSIFLGKNYLISINDGPGDLFEPVRRRIRNMGKPCEHGTDYLLYALADVIVDSGFSLLEALGDQLEALEDEILDNPGHEARNKIHCIKRELVQMRRVWWPQREVIAALMRDDGHFLSDITRLYMRDCYDHCVIVIDFVETYREMASNLLDTYLSAVSQRMNDVMKALTIIATIFLPLMFLTGLYGMNFDTESPWNLPELHWRFGYFYVLSVMAAVVIGMLIYFRRKRWL